MNKKISILIVIVVGLSGLLPIVDAGDETNPEIEDPVNDLMLFGMIPARIMNRFCPHIDVLAAWFFEKSSDPDYLFVSIQVSEYRSASLMAFYAVFWNHDQVDYAIFSMHEKNRIVAGVQFNENQFVEIEDCLSIDEEDSVLTYRIPKNVVGDPEPGAVCEPFFALAALRFHSEDLANMVQRMVGTNVLLADFTSYGTDYVIQY